MYVTKNINGIGDAFTDAAIAALVQVAKGYAQTKCPNVTGITDASIEAAIIAAVASGKSITDPNTANSVIDSLCAANTKTTVTPNTATTTTANPNAKWYYIAGIGLVTVGMYFAFHKKGKKGHRR